MSVLNVKMVGGPFCVPCVTHRRWRRFPAKINIFGTQYDTQICSVFQAEQDDILFKAFSNLVAFPIENEEDI